MMDDTKAGITQGFRDALGRFTLPLLSSGLSGADIDRLVDAWFAGISTAVVVVFRGSPRESKELLTLLSTVRDEYRPAWRDDKR